MNHNNRTSIPIIYKDINQFNPTKVGYVSNAQSIYQSVYNIVTTRKGERIFNPRYGVFLEDSLFEFSDDITRNLIISELINAVNEFEPRVNILVNESDVILQPNDNAIELTLIFEIQGIEGAFEISEIIRR
jgi:phage baseplate assembly protein W